MSLRPLAVGELTHRLSAVREAAAYKPGLSGKFDLQMTKSWLIALFVAGLSSGQAFADCVPSPDTPASVIEYFQKFNKPLPEQFCVKENAPHASEGPSQESPQAYEDATEASPRDGPSGHYAQVSPEYAPVPEEQRYPPPPDGVWPRHFEFRSKHFGFEWFC